MRADIEEICDSLDAAIFSGDGFLDPVAIKELREYMARWERGLKEHEDVLQELKDSQDPLEEEVP